MREGPAPTGGAVMSAGTADDLCRHAAGLRRAATGVAVVLTGVQPTGGAGSPGTPSAFVLGTSLVSAEPARLDLAV
ncbi:hypothetical protein ND748_27910, partial [Frankia sp. AiPs1]|uniref:hypothetical protein n=1 Tax=Frankia sp. AiPs1 TaxID=573493 RepID=UPI002043CC50